jgi:2-methylcitrate dehydratase
MTSESNIKPDFDPEIKSIANYVRNYEITSESAYQTAYYCFMDALGCALLAHRFPECVKLLGPIVPEPNLQNGARVLGTQFQLEPVQAAFNNGVLIRWLDYNDTWLAAEWGHPSDNLGGILSISDYISRQRQSMGLVPYTVKDILTTIIKAYEIQGIFALENSFNQAGLDHVILVKLATASVAADMLGASMETLCNAISLVWLDGQSLRTYRHAPNTGTRKSWAAGDATSRGIRLALLALLGEMGYPSVISVPKWGFNDVYFKGQPLKLSQEFSSYVIENILFKISYPAEFHGQTAVECALKLHDQVKEKLQDIEAIYIRTQESAYKIINKQGPLYNAADRDHSLQYMIAVALIYGDLTSEHYEDEIAKNPLIDELRAKMEVSEDRQFSQDYLDPQKRSIANSLQIKFKDGSMTEQVVVEYPLGHKRRRSEGIPLLLKKFKHNIATRLSKQRVQQVIEFFEDKEKLLALPITDLMNLFAI